MRLMSRIIYIIRDTLQADLVVMIDKKTAWKNPGKLERNAYEQGIHIYACALGMTACYVQFYYSAFLHYYQVYFINL